MEPRTIPARGDAAPTIDELIGRAIPYLRRVFPLIAAGVGLGVALAAAKGLAWGTTAAIVAVGGLAPFWLWIFRIGRGLPFVAAVAVQEMLWFLTPLASGHKLVAEYSDEEVLAAGLELATYFAAMFVAYAVVAARPARAPGRYLTLRLDERSGLRKAVWACVAAMALCGVFEAMMLDGSLWDYIGTLPEGSVSVLRAGFGVLGTACSLLVAYAVARRAVSRGVAAAAAAVWVFFLATRVASVYVSHIVPPAAAVAFGIFLARGRIPWRFALVVLLVAAYLNFGKFVMRERYWQDSAEVITISDLPSYYLEWAEASWEVFNGRSPLRAEGSAPERQSIVERVSTLHMLLYVQRQVGRYNTPALGGDTYTVIPQLFVPRLVWPEKPRGQIGQVMLNTHFKLQSEAQTWTTYISWGMLPEAFGNFGSVLGPAAIGLALGALLGWVERFTAGLPLDSLRSLIGCVLFLGIVGVSERVASTQATTTFQTAAAVCLGMIPFLRRATTPGEGPSGRTPTEGATGTAAGPRSGPAAASPSGAGGR